MASSDLMFTPVGDLAARVRGGELSARELTEATRRVLEATSVEFDWDVQHAGSDVMDQYDGNPLPDHVLDAIRESGVAGGSPGS